MQKLSLNPKVWTTAAIIVILGLVVLFIFGTYNAQYKNSISNLSAKLEFIIHVWIILAVFIIYKKNSQDQRKILTWFLMINLGLLLNDCTFYTMVYIRKTLVINDSLLMFILNYTPLSLWIASSIIFLYLVLTRFIISIKRFLKLFGLLLLINIVIMYLFLSALHYAFTISSWQSFSQIILVWAQLIIYDIAIICLIYTENNGISFFLIGLIVLVSGDILIIDSIIAQESTLIFSGELLWLLGLIFMLFGTWLIIFSNNYDINKWFQRNNTIKNRLAFWSFSTSTGGFLFFFVLAYSMSIIDKSFFAELPLFIMIYSIITVVSSIFLGN